MRFLLSVTLVIATLTFNNAPANANLQGCPETWAAPTSGWAGGETMPRELEQLKASLGFNVAITAIGPEISRDGRSWISQLGTDRGLIAFYSSMSGGFGRYGYKVQVVNCPTVVTRYYPFRLATYEIEEPVKDFNQFFSDSDNRDFFRGPRDFTRIEATSKLVESCVQQIQRDASRNQSINNVVQNYSQVVFANGLYQYPSYGGCLDLKTMLDGMNLYYVDDKCHKSDPAAAIQGYIRIVAGTECELILGSHKYTAFDLSKGVIVPLARFLVKGPETLEAKYAAGLAAAAAEKAAAEKAAAEKAAAEKARLEARAAAREAARLARQNQITITCTKGKTIQKVRSQDPKCPKGFKKTG